MKKRKNIAALLLLSLGALCLTGCGGSDVKDDPNKNGNTVVGPKVEDDKEKIEVECASCGKKVKVKKDDEKCPDCGGDLYKLCTKHTWSEWVKVSEPTEGTPGKEVATCTNCGRKKEQSIPALGYLQNVTFKNADGSVLKTEQIRSVNKIEKPADPTAPEGKVFYGWKNTNNGGQIWNFDDDTLGKPQEDVVLEPLFIPANINPQYLEAELAPVIQANGGIMVQLTLVVLKVNNLSMKILRKNSAQHVKSNHSNIILMTIHSYLLFQQMIALFLQVLM